VGDVANVDELMESHRAQLLDEDPVKLDTAKVTEQTEDEPVGATVLQHGDGRCSA
jgi:hypothetical protein